MLSADIYDVAPSTSAVEILSRNGIDPWVVDFGAPEREEGGLERSLNDHVLAIDEAIDRVREETGRDKIHIGGYSQGGMFCYQVASYRRSEGIDSIVVFGSPVDTRGTLSFGLPEDAAIGAAAFLAEHVFATSGVPAWMSRTGFRLLDPGEVPAAAPRLRPPASRPRVAAAEGAPASLPRGRRLGRLARPGSRRRDPPVRRPQPARLRRLRDRGPARHARRHDLPDPRVRRRERRDRTGPLGPRGPLGGAAIRRLRGQPPRRPFRPRRRLDGRRDDLADRGGLDAVARRATASCRRASSGSRRSPSATRAASAPRIGSAPGAQLAVGAGIGTVQALAGAAMGASRTLREIVGDTAGQLDQLNRLGRVNPRTRISFGLLLDEQAEEEPDDVVSALRGSRPHPPGRQGAGRQRRPRACSRSASGRASTSAS